MQTFWACYLMAQVGLREQKEKGDKEEIQNNVVISDHFAEV